MHDDSWIMMLGDQKLRVIFRINIYVKINSGTKALDVMWIMKGFNLYYKFWYYTNIIERKKENK